MKLKSQFSTSVDVDGDTMEITIKRLDFDEANNLRAGIRILGAAENRNSDNAGQLAEEHLRETITNFVTVKSKVLLETEDGREIEIKTGEQLCNVFAGRNEVLHEIYAAVLRENMMSEKEKKASRSRTGSLLSSGEPKRGPVGSKPETTAASVANGSSAVQEDATPRAALPSGSTGAEKKTQSQPSSSMNVPSYR